MKKTAHPVDRTANWCTHGGWFSLAFTMVFMKNIKPCSLKVESICMQHKRAISEIGLTFNTRPLACPHPLNISPVAIYIEK